MKTKIHSILAFTLTLCLLCSCSQTTAQGGETPETTTVIPTTLLDTATLFSTRDKEVGYTESDAVLIQLNGTKITANDSRVTVSGTTATITDEGTYILSGNLTNGQIIVDAEKTDKVQLVLNGVSIHCDTSAAIYVRQADKTFVTLAHDTKNTLSNKNDFVAIDDNSIDGVLFAKDDITLNGSGALTINAFYGDGVVAKDELTITGGVYSITSAQGHGIAAKDSIAVSDGSFTITSAKDGFHAENKDDATLGNLYIGGGSLTVNAQGDAFDASAILQIDGGTFDLKTAGGSAAAPEKETDTMMAPGNRPTGATPPTTTSNTTSETAATSVKTTATTTVTAEDTTPSTKGIKAGGDLMINDGTFSLDTYDDAVHTNGGLTVNGGTFTISTGDDGFHADGDLAITNGKITVAKCYEGVEGETILVAGGDITVTASDDGLNAAEKGEDDSETFDPTQLPQDMTPPTDSTQPTDGTQPATPPTTQGTANQQTSGGMGKGGGGFGVSENCTITISDGKLNIAAGGDGIDSNGTLTISGGEIYVSTNAGGADSPLDCDGETTVTGGTIVAVGASGMFHGFGTNSTQGWLSYGLTTTQSGAITLKSGSSTLLTYTPEKSYANVLISTPAVKQGATFTLQMGTEEQSITMEDSSYTGGTTTGFGGGRGNGMKGGTRPERGTTGQSGTGTDASQTS